MASICTLVIRGGKKPFVVLVTSKAAEAWGVVVPTQLRFNFLEQLFIAF
jgi:hypothetical protein